MKTSKIDKKFKGWIIIFLNVKLANGIKIFEKSYMG